MSSRPSSAPRRVPPAADGGTDAPCASTPPAPLPSHRPLTRQPEPAALTDAAREVEPRTAVTLVSFGFKYGRPPANHVFDVSFLKNPAREASWGLWSSPSEEMRHWVLAQPAAVEFLAAALPCVRFLAGTDDDVRIAFGCSAGRHRSTILVEELARRLRAEGLEVAVHHREREFA